MPLDPKKLGKRALTALTGFLVLGVFVLWLDKPWFHLLLAVLGLLGVREFKTIAAGFGFRFHWVPVALTVLFGLATLYLPYLHLSWLPYLVLLSASLLSLAPPVDVKKAMVQLGICLTASGYLGMAIIGTGHIFSISDGGDKDLGRFFTVFFLIMVWSSDSAAYLVGSTIGKHRISPVVSPKKTWEGATAGLVGTFLAALIVRQTFLPMLTLPDIFLLSSLFGVLGFFGDIVESSWKRGSQIKDSSTLFPGHGGVLDRLDSIFLTAPIFYFYIVHVVLELN